MTSALDGHTGLHPNTAVTSEDARLSSQPNSSTAQSSSPAAPASSKQVSSKYSASDIKLLRAALALATAHHALYDPSHDLHHVQRVTALAVQIADSISEPVDRLVVHLAGLSHDLCDAKYANGSKKVARDVLESLWAEHGAEMSEERRRLVERIVDNVSYSKEVKRIAAGGQTEWHLSCVELHCVQDADKLDAIGGFGILRCAAYSGASSVPLHSPHSPITPAVAAPPSKSTAIDHFHEKLLKLEGMMKTEKGRQLAKQRTEFMRGFVEQVEREQVEYEPV